MNATSQAPAAASDAPVVLPPPHPPNQFANLLRQNFASCPSFENCPQVAVQMVMRMDRVVAAVYFRCVDDSFVPGSSLACQAEFAEIAPQWEPVLRNLSVAVRDAGQSQLSEIVVGERIIDCAAAPLVVNGTVSGIFCMLVYHRENSGDARPVVELVASELLHRIRAFHPQISEPAADLSLVESLLRQSNIAAACRVLAQRTRQQLDVEHVLIGVPRGQGRTAAVAAISDVAEFDKKSELCSGAEEVFAEAIIRNQTVAYDIVDPAATSAMRQLSQLCETPVVSSGVIHDAEDQPAAAFVVLAKKSVNPQELPAAVNAALAGVGPCLALMRRAEPGLWCRCLAFLHRLRQRPKAVAIGAAVLCGLMSLPWPFKVKCDCTMQAVTRRYVPVPYDGVLEEVLVEPGDVVTAGQVLARMDHREINLQLSSERAELGRARKEYDSSLAKADTAAAQIARLEMDRYQLKVQLLSEYAQHLEIKSAMDGVIIGGDPRRREGARFNQGVTLFETAPLEQMLAEIHVPDDQIDHVQPGMKVRIRLDAYPGHKVVGQIQRIKPSAEVRDGENVFIAEVELENPQHLLRPGMMGRAKIRSRFRALGWILFHRAWDQLAYRLAW